MSSPSHDALAGLRLGRFEILERIGVGAIGSVYRARDTRDGSAVAVKILSKEFAAKSTAVRRFEREASVVRRLKHKNIVSAIEFGSDSGQVYLAMELIPGMSLEARLLRDQALSPDLAADIARQIADAVAAAHEAGVIHRDLKPANVMLVGPDQAVTVKIVDFGVASGYEDEHGQPITRLTQTGFTVGTPAYMAPEQFSSANVGPEADLYSLGLILYEMLAGVAAFTGTLREIILEQMTNVPPPLPAYGGLGELVQRLVVKNPAQRPKDARRIREELAEIGGGLVKTHLTPLDPGVSGISMVTTQRLMAPGSLEKTLPMELTAPSIPFSAVPQWPADRTMPMALPPVELTRPPLVSEPDSAPGAPAELWDEASAALVLPVEAIEQELEARPPSTSTFDALRVQLARPLMNAQAQTALVGAAAIVFFGALAAALGSLYFQRSRAIVVQPSIVSATSTAAAGVRTSTRPWSLELEP
jgi:serine/threonine protein kinase